jgi:TRAP-type mannitol/chloroaromatic compound transport system substrate-binding protein
MKNKSLISLISAATLTLSIVSTSAIAGDNTVKRLKLPVWFGTHLTGLGSSPLFFADTVNKASGGNIKVKIYEPGKLVATKEMLESVSNGSVNAGWGTPGYNTGLLGKKAAIFSAVPFGPEAPEFMAWVYYGGGRDLWQKLYDDAGYNVHAIPCSIIAPETSGWFTKEINSAADLEGLRMRFFGLGANVMEKLGVSTSLLAAGDIMPALEKGAIDATEFSMPAIDKLLGFPKLLKHNYYPGWHQPSTMFDLIINGNMWDSMDESQQTTIETACKATMLDGLALGEAIQFDYMKANVEAGVTNHYWSDEMLALFEAKWLEVVDELTAEDPEFGEIYGALNEFRANYKIWQEWIYLPRPSKQGS